MPRGEAALEQALEWQRLAEAVDSFDNEHAAMLAERFPGETLLVPHRVWALVAWAQELDHPHSSKPGGRPR